MATIISPGRKPEPPASWYLKQPVTCPQCGCVFQLDKKDFAEQGAHQFNTHVDWQVVATARTPNGEQIIAGKCPDCRETVRITGRMGGLSTIGGIEDRPLNGGY